MSVSYLRFFLAYQLSTWYTENEPSVRILSSGISI